VLADTSDTEVALLLQNHLVEIDVITGKECCFVYFRNLDEAKNFSIFNFSEHSRQVYSFARFLGIDTSKFPCLVFFNQVNSGEYILMSLAGQSHQEIIQFTRQIFDYLYKHKGSNPLNQLKKFKYGQTMQITKQVLLQSASQIGRDTF